MQPIPVSARTALAFVLAAPLVAQQWQFGTEITGRSYPAVAYDAVHAELVLFGGGTYTGVSDETWLHDGSEWRKAAPANRPPARQSSMLAHDIVRGRTVLFGGLLANNVRANDTWEWDGSTWLQIATTNAPTARINSALAFDAARMRVVLFGGEDTAVLGDTWTYDGTNWTQVVVSIAPAPRREHALAYDSLRARTVLFGSGPTPTADTWEFDGVVWTQVNTPVAPPWRRSHGMAFDAARGHVVVFSGFGPGILVNPYADTWEYDGATWTQRMPAHTPGPQWSSHLEYDHARQRTVMFGGVNSPGEQANTWYWDGTDWSDHSEPSARDATALADDTLRGRTVMFGGMNSAWLQDTWEHDGVRWTRITTATGPLRLSGPALAFDAQRARTVLFGGSFFNTCYDETWDYDGVAWTVRQLAVRPTARQNHAMAYDRARRRVVLFGGQSGGNPGAYLNDTWEFDGNAWLLITPASILPAARTRTAMVYETSRGRVLLFGGTNNYGWAGFSDTWAWNGTAWQQLAPSVVPPARNGHGLAHDALRGRTLLFGGTVNSTLMLGDAWEFDGDDWTPVAATPAPPAHRCGLVYQQHTGRTLSYGGGVTTTRPVAGTTYFVPAATPTFTRYGRGCAGSAGVPVLDTVPPALPALGTSFPLQLSGLPSAPGVALLVFGFDLVRWNGQALPIDLGAFGLPGCDAWIGPASGLSVLVPYAGSATHSLFLPASPALAGLVLGAQALVLDAAAPSGLGSVSNAAILRIH
jgi:hypothetical protein